MLRAPPKHPSNILLHINQTYYSRDLSWQGQLEYLNDKQQDDFAQYDAQIPPRTPPV